VVSAVPLGVVQTNMSDSNAIKTILFVENDPVSLAMYQNRLQREGFYVKTATDGLAALKILSGPVPDIVVLDLMLPRFSGSEVFKFIRTDPRLRNLPVVIFSNAAMSEWPQDIAVGATQCLLKSESTFPALLQTIHDLLAAVAAGAIPTVPDNLPSNKSPKNEASTRPVVESESPTAPEPTAAKSPGDFFKSALLEIPKLREHCLAYIKAPASDAGKQHVSRLSERIHALSQSANEQGCTHVAQLTKAFAALLAEITVKTSWMTPSVLQTIAQAVDCLNYLLDHAEASKAEPATRPKVLAVDDDPICNRVMVTTLKRANFDIVSMESPLTALQDLQSNRYDVILLDVNMPDLTGFELCNKLRQLSHCKATPVVFITAFNNFENRKQSVLSGGDDFITKPVSPLELALKVTIHLLKSRVQRGNAPVIEPPAASTRNNPPSIPALETTRTIADESSPSHSLVVATTTSGTTDPSETESRNLTPPSPDKTSEESLESVASNRVNQPIPVSAGSEASLTETQAVEKSIPELVGAQVESAPFTAAATNETLTSHIAPSLSQPANAPLPISSVAPTFSEAPMSESPVGNIMTQPASTPFPKEIIRDVFQNAISGNSAALPAEYPAPLPQSPEPVAPLQPVDSPSQFTNLFASTTESATSNDSSTIEGTPMVAPTPLPDVFQMAPPAETVQNDSTPSAATTIPPTAEIPSTFEEFLIIADSGEPFAAAITQDNSPANPTASESIFSAAPDNTVFASASDLNMESVTPDTLNVSSEPQPNSEPFSAVITQDTSVSTMLPTPSEPVVETVTNGPAFSEALPLPSEIETIRIASLPDAQPANPAEMPTGDQDIFQFTEPVKPEGVAITEAELPLSIVSQSTPESIPQGALAIDSCASTIMQPEADAPAFQLENQRNAIEQENTVFCVPPVLVTEANNFHTAVPELPTPTPATEPTAEFGTITVPANDPASPAIAQSVPVEVPLTEPNAIDSNSQAISATPDQAAEQEAPAATLDTPTSEGKSPDTEELTIDFFIQTPVQPLPEVPAASPATSEGPEANPASVQVEPTPASAAFETPAPAESTPTAAEAVVARLPENNPVVPAAVTQSEPNVGSAAPTGKTPEEVFNTIVDEVARLMFGDDDLSEMNLRLVRRALQRQNIPTLLQDLAKK
jgi:CheY-like chemotaxis protein